MLGVEVVALEGADEKNSEWSELAVDDGWLKDKHVSVRVYARACVCACVRVCVGRVVCTCQKSETKAPGAAT